MAEDDLRQRLLVRLDAMSPRLQQAARHLIDHPQDVALLSMRELARHAGVPPATMTRLAQFMGAEGFEALRAEQVAKIRGHKTGLVAHAAVGSGVPAGNGPEAVIAAQLASLEALPRRFAAASIGQVIGEVVADLSAARRIHLLGSRSCHSVAWQLCYVLSLLGRDAVLLDGPGGTGADGLLRARSGDVLLVISVSPYARRSLDIACEAGRQGLRVLALTDSAASPLIRHAARAIICPPGDGGMFHSLVPLLAVAEMICALLAADDPEFALAAMTRADAQLAALDSYVIRPVSGQAGGPGGKGRALSG